MYETANLAQIAVAVENDAGLPRTTQNTDVNVCQRLSASSKSTALLKKFESEMRSTGDVGVGAGNCDDHQTGSETLLLIAV